MLAWLVPWERENRPGLWASGGFGFGHNCVAGFDHVILLVFVLFGGSVCCGDLLNYSGWQSIPEYSSEMPKILGIPHMPAMLTYTPMRSDLQSRLPHQFSC